MSRSPRLAAPRTLTPAALLFVGTFLGALLGYAFFVVLGRALSPDDLGAVGSLVNLSTILSVPGLGLQLVTARRVAGSGLERVGVPGLVVSGLLLGGLPGLALAALAPVLAPALHLGSVLPVVLLAVSSVPMTLTYAGLGVLQGAELFAALGLAALVTGVAKLGAGVVSAALDEGVVGVMAWYAAGWFGLALFVAVLVPRPRPTAGSVIRRPSLRRSISLPPVGLSAHVWSDGLVRAREALVGAMPTAGLLVLSSLDLLLARHHLARADSGVYTMGALFEKVAFWGPQFVATMTFPRMARPAERRAAIRSALGLTAGVGVVGVAVAAGAGDLLVRLVAGPGYVADLGSLAWVFTALGVALALVQVLVYADLAAHGHRVGLAVWATVLVATGAVAVWHASVTFVVTVVLACVLTLIAAGRLLLTPGTDAPPPPVGADVV